MFELAARSVAFGHEGDFDGRDDGEGSTSGAEGELERRFAGAGVQEGPAKRGEKERAGRERQRKQIRES